jgi:hypothetical protein
MKKLNMNESAVLENLSCIPGIVNHSKIEIERNIDNAKIFFKLENDSTALNKLLNEYPLLITNFSSDMNKIEFYFNLYMNMSKEDFSDLANKFPLIMTCSVNILYIIQ